MCIAFAIDCDSLTPLYLWVHFFSVDLPVDQGSFYCRVSCACVYQLHMCSFCWPHLMKLLWYHIHLVTATCAFTWFMAVVRLEPVQADSYNIRLWYTTATWLKTLWLDIALKLCWCDFARDAHMIVVVARRWHRCTHTIAHTSHVVASVSVAWRQATFYIDHASLMVSECMSSYTCIV